MEKNISVNGKNISYIDNGQGGTVVLLHGYLETKEVWGEFATDLTKQYRVIIPDIPGHGKSDYITEKQTMEMVADSLNVMLDKLNVNSCTVVGHSMGGYVMLAFAEKYKEKTDSIVIFHSSVYADSDEKKASRLEEIKRIKNGKLPEVINNHIPKTFANDNVMHFSSNIEELKKNAREHSATGVCAMINAMAYREDKSKMISNYKKPILFVFGEKDNFISSEVATKMLKLSENSTTEWLSNSGHMGFIEERKKSFNILRQFINLKNNNHE